jgi:hypothetical protein
VRELAVIGHDLDWLADLARSEATSDPTATAWANDTATNDTVTNDTVTNDAATDGAVTNEAVKDDHTEPVSPPRAQPQNTTADAAQTTLEGNHD